MAGKAIAISCSRRSKGKAKGNWSKTNNNNWGNPTWTNSNWGNQRTVPPPGQQPPTKLASLFTPQPQQTAGAKRHRINELQSPWANDNNCLGQCGQIHTNTPMSHTVPTQHSTTTPTPLQHYSTNPLIPPRPTRPTSHDTTLQQNPRANHCLGHIQTTQTPTADTQRPHCVDDYYLLEVIVDPGACDHVGPPNLLPTIPIQETQASKRNLYYRAANGSKIQCWMQRHQRAQ